MKLRFTFNSAYRAVIANKVRSGLTVLGIVIGITAIMLIVSIGEGAQSLILGQIQGLGAETIVLRPGREPKGPTDFAQTLFSDSIKTRELEALKRKENAPDVVSLAPVVFVSETISYLGETYRPSILGWSAEFMLTMGNIKLGRGEIFDDTDIRQEASVAIIGSKVAEELFGPEDPIGKFVRIKGKNFRVIGLLEKKGGGSFFNSDEIVVIPYTTAQTYLTGSNHFQEIMIRASSPENVPRTVRDITATLRELHNIAEDEKDDFYIETQQGVIEQVGTILTALTAFLSAVSAIALVVGGIGVMNVMLVSVTERTREIGLRKALGARNIDILLQFLAEAVILTLLGGLVGMTLGAIFGYLASVGLSQGLDLDWKFSFPWKAMLVGLGVAFLVGVVFGIYPARQASKKSPIEALRYE
jgi:putative ABC transport system permease protein